MDRKSVITFVAIYAVVAGIGFFSLRNSAAATAAPKDAAYIVQADSAAAAALAVRSVGGHVNRHLIVISAVSATLADDEVAMLRDHSERFTVFEARDATHTVDAPF